MRSSWSRHNQQRYWRLGLRSDLQLPQWLRVAYLAYGTHWANGHAPFGVESLRAYLGEVDGRTGEVVRLVDQDNVYRAIRTAVQREHLDPASTADCLRVPHRLAGGLGKMDAPCSVCDLAAPEPMHPTLRSGLVTVEEPAPPLWRGEPGRAELLAGRVLAAGRETCTQCGASFDADGRARCVDCIAWTAARDGAARATVTR